MNTVLKYHGIIAQMTLEEKASLMSGENFWNTKSIERLGIPSMMLTDGPHGLRKQGGKSDHLGLHKSIPATCFPTAATLANSWDQELLEEVGACLGREAANEKVSVLLGPGLNIKRNPLCGRNFEYFSEDPFLSGQLAASMIRGIQKQGISACPKHFAVNSQETHRMSVDELVDQRALHEIYLEGFRYAVSQGKAKTIMTSYNKVNGAFANENTYILDEVLQRQWGFDGLIVTDWGGNNDRVKGLVAGNGLEMPSTNGMTDREIVDAVNSGCLSETLLDQRVDTYLKVLFQIEPALKQPEPFTKQEHHDKAIEAAARSMVLLKNENAVLPLCDDGQRIAVIGDFAEHSRYQGAGSSLIHPTQLDHALDVLSKQHLTISGYEPGYRRLGGKSKSRLKKAVSLARNSDVVVLFLGLDESSEAEGVDRKTMALQDNQIELTNALTALSKPVVVVLCGGAPVELPFLDRVSAVVHAYLPGQGGGKAIANVLTGRYNPSGKLAESYPIHYKDVPSHLYYPGAGRSAEHRESIYVGYRYYEKAGIETQFPFGHGLSYTSFAYSALDYADRCVSVSVKNTGDVYGEEIIQVYCKAHKSVVFRPDKELKAFSKIGLKPGQQKRVSLLLDEHAFAYYHVGEKRWTTEAGAYQILVGASSQDIRLTTTIDVSGESLPSPYDANQMNEYFNGSVQHIRPEQFERLLGCKLPVSNWDLTQLLTYENLIKHGKYAGWFGRFLYRLICFAHKLLRRLGKPVASNNVIFALELPFLSVARMSGGRVNMQMLDGLLTMVNGRFWRGLAQYIKAAKEKKRLETATDRRNTHV